MTNRPTDHKNINLRQLNRDIIHGNSRGRVLWQPRIICWYGDREFSKVDMPAPYTGMTIKQLYEALECSNRIYDYNAAIFREYDSSVVFNSERIDDLRVKQTITTPVGTIYQVIKSNTSNYGQFQEKWYIEDEEDMKVMMYVEENSTYGYSQEGYDSTYAEWGDNGEGSIYFPRVSVQSLFNETCGVEGAIYALMDYPDLCHEYFEVRHKKEMDFIKLLNKSPFEWINFGDNIHCGTLPPNLFEKYVLRYYQERNELFHEAEKYTFAHWDGDTKTILKYAKETGLNGIEAITPIPQGDVTLEEVKQALGDDVDLIDGIPAVLFDETYPIEMLKECTQKVIDLFAGHLVLGISDEMSSTGNIDRIKTVGEIVDNHNSKCM